MKIVLLPGLEGTGLLFKPLIELLPKEIDFQVIAYPLDKKLSYKELADWVLPQLPKENFILVGESFSGYIAYQIVLTKPKNLKLVVFVASFLEPPCPLFLSLSRFLPARLILSAPIPNGIIKLFLLGSDACTKVIALFKQAMRQANPDVLCYRLQEIAKLSVNNHQFSEVRAIYIQATNDKLVPESCIESFKKMFNCISVIQIKGPHFILQTQPLACLEAIMTGST